MTEAAAMAALLASPPTTAIWEWPRPATGKPSLRQMQPGRAGRAAGRRRPPVRGDADRSAPCERSPRPPARALSANADAVWRRVCEEGDTDDPLGRDRPPEPTVVGVGAVVAHHEVLTGRNDD